MKRKNSSGITLIALVITIIVLLILAGASLSAALGDNGIISKAILATNETEYAAVKEALALYYLREDMGETLKNPVNEKLEQGTITNEREQGYVVGDQGVNVADNIMYDRLYYLDGKTLGVNIDSEKYYMDIETRNVYIHNGIELSSGTIFKIDLESGITTTENNILAEGSKIYALKNSTIVVKENGDMYGVGEIGYNYLGLYYDEELYDTTYRPQKTNIKVIPENEATDEDFIKVVSNGNSTYFLKKNGDVYKARMDDLEKVNINNVKDMFCCKASETVYFLKTDKTLWGLGRNIIHVNSNISIRLILNEDIEEYKTPVQISYKKDGVEIFEDIELMGETYFYYGCVVIVKENGEIWSTLGYKTSGKFGDGTSENVIINEPQRLTALEELVSNVGSKIKKAYTSANSMVVLLENNEVYSTGSSADNGLNGNNTTTFEKVIDGVEELYVGYNNWANHAFYAKKTDGSLYTWGSYIGVTEETNILTPTLFTINDSNLKKASSCIALTENGKVYRIGLVVVNGTRISEYTNIQARDIFNQGIIDTENYVWLFGGNLIGDRGKKIVLTKSNITDVEDVFCDTNVYNVTIRKKDGSYYSWGNNGYKVISEGAESIYYTPQKLEESNVISSEITSIKNFKIGRYNSYIIDQSGNLWHKGYETAMASSRLTQFTKATNISNVKDVFCTGYATIVQKEDGTLWSIGGNTQGETGLGTENGSITREFTQIIKDNNGNTIDFTSMKKGIVGYERMTALLEDGSIYSWGNGIGKTWGVTNEPYVLKPIKITYFEEIGEKVIDIIDTRNNIICLTESGNVYVCGDNIYGQLGIGNKESVQGIQKAKISNVKQIVAGESHIIAIKEDNTIWAWGSGGYGQLGTEKTDDATTPIPANYLMK